MIKVFKYFRWYFLFLMLFLFESGMAQSKYGGTIFSMTKDPGGEALGGAVVAENSGIYSLIWNPAGLAQCENISFGFIHSKVFISDISYNFAGASFKYRKHHIGLAMVRIGIEDIKDSRNAIRNGSIYYPDIKYFNVADYLFIAGIAPERNNSRLKYGVNLKYIYRGYNIETASGFGLDAGVLFELMENLIVGAKLNNVFGSMILWSTGKKEWIKPELSYGLKYQKTFFDRFTAAGYLNAFHYFDNRRESAASNIGFISNEMAIGMKVEYKNNLSLSLGKDQLGNFTYGAGINIPHIFI
ncbi:MAG: hypothetical protein KAR38_16895, partial [Calditrichia bacterium]|nr:hypothetical protein [Calditrichia bacterium]